MASDIHFLAISCLCCHNAPAAFKCCGRGNREKERMLIKFYSNLDSKPHFFCFNLVTTYNFYLFLTKHFIPVKDSCCPGYLAISFWIILDPPKNWEEWLFHSHLYMFTFKTAFLWDKKKQCDSCHFLLETMCSSTCVFIKRSPLRKAASYWVIHILESK